MPRRRLLLLLTLSTLVLVVAVCGAGLWVVSLFNVNDASLVGVGQPDLATYDCLVGGRFIRPGPSLNVATEWVIDADLVPVLASFRRQGWQSTTHMASDIKMLPDSPTTFDLGLLRVKVFRALALSYTQAGTTRVVVNTRLVACPP